MFNFLAQIGTDGAGIKLFEKMFNFFYELKQVLHVEFILYASIALLCLVILICLAVSSKTYEAKVLKYVKTSNKYFKKNSHITEDNLMFVNNKFKKAPKNVRYAWQQYMLNRDKLPSDYINTRTCLDQPLKSSSAENTAKILNITTVIIALLAFVANIINFLGMEQVSDVINWEINHNNIASWLYIFTIPCLVYILGAIFVIILKARHTAIVGDVYTEFQDFERYLNKACSTMPSYIDYEVLFTRKEIRDGIPALQEYLEKRALEEQREREAQEMNKFAFEEYNFEELGLENALLIERAMTESEKFFNVKRTLGEKISSKQTEMSSYQKNFDEVTKEFEKKAQAYRENLKQLNEQLNSTSVNIEANYIKKRYREDQQKLQQLEKDYEIASIRFNKQQSEINAEVENYQKEIKRKKEELQRAMTEEGKSYANKIYGIINDKVVEQNKPIFDEQVAEIESMKKQIEELSLQVREKENQLEDIEKEKDALAEEIMVKKTEIEGIKNLREYLTSPEFAQVVINRKKQRKSSGIDGMNIEELRDRTATAEEELRIANAKQQEMAKTEQELLEKLKRLEANERQLIRENEELSGVKISDKIQKATRGERKESKLSDINNINNDIDSVNNSIMQDEEEFMGKLNKTLKKLDESEQKDSNVDKVGSLMSKLSKVEKSNSNTDTVAKVPQAPVQESATQPSEEKKPAGKKSLNSLMANVSKLKSKTKKD